MKNFYFLFIFLIIGSQLKANEWTYISNANSKLYKDISLSGNPISIPNECKSKILKEESAKLFVDCDGRQGWILKIHTSPVSSNEKPLQLGESDFKRQSINRSRARLNDISGTLASRGFLYSEKDSSKIFQTESIAESNLIWLEKITQE
jgi:hypothetical protein